MQGTVLIIGLGLIGGSLGINIRNGHPNVKIIGYDKSLKELRLAKAMDIIDEMAVTLQEAAEQSDLIIISTPVFQTEQIIHQLSTYNLKEQVVVTDTGSTKEQIMKTARILTSKNITFIGGHPMAGSHKSGVSAAKPILFENAFYLLTPPKNVAEKVINRLMNWLEGTKAKFVIINSREHDELTAVVSHFPHIIAASLVHQARVSSENHPIVRRLAAGGFRDVTRIASSNPLMWKDITVQNRNVLLNLMESWKAEMEEIISMIKDVDEHKIMEYFQVAKQFRDELPLKSKGAIPSFYDLFVGVPDYPGVISEVTGYLAKAKISLTNIRIMETREDVYGVLVISFQTDEDRQRAKECLSMNTDFELFLG